jgi:hypothetical protein
MACPENQFEDWYEGALAFSRLVARLIVELRGFNDVGEIEGLRRINLLGLDTCGTILTTNNSKVRWTFDFTGRRNLLILYASGEMKLYQHLTISPNRVERNAIINVLTQGLENIEVWKIKLETFNFELALP